MEYRLKYLKYYNKYHNLLNQFGGVNNDENECSICFNNIEQANKIVLICNHFFHFKCINNWFKHQKNTCPSCRGHADIHTDYLQKFITLENNDNDNNIINDNNQTNLTENNVNRLIINLDFNAKSLYRTIRNLENNMNESNENQLDQLFEQYYTNREKRIKLGKINDDFMFDNTNRLLNRNINLIKQLVSKNGLILNDILNTYRDNPKIVLRAVRQNGLALQYTSLRENKDIVLAAVKQNGVAIQYASRPIKTDMDIIFAALNNTIDAITFIDHPIDENDERWKIIHNRYQESNSDNINVDWSKDGIHNTYKINYFRELRSAYKHDNRHSKSKNINLDWSKDGIHNTNNINYFKDLREQNNW